MLLFPHDKVIVFVSLLSCQSGGDANAARQQVCVTLNLCCFVCMEASISFSADGNSDEIDVEVKGIFADTEFVQRHRVISTNSINWARVLSQVGIYYSVPLVNVLMLAFDSEPVTFHSSLIVCFSCVAHAYLRASQINLNVSFRTDDTLLLRLFSHVRHGW